MASVTIPRRWGARIYVLLLGPFELARVIAADTRLVVVNRTLEQRIERRDRVSFSDLLRGSVQWGAYRIDALRLKPIGNRADVYGWPFEYDPKFLGYMGGVLPLADLNKAGFAVIE